MRKENSAQLSLFEHVKATYAASNGPVDNSVLYAQVAARAGISSEEFARRSAIGHAGTPRSTYEREVRWHQQTLKQAGWLERVPNANACWSLTKHARDSLRLVKPGVALVAFSTSLGVAIWGSCRTVFTSIDEPIALAITSPPYPLRRARAYGNPLEAEYIDFICEQLEPIVRHLRPGGSIVLNISNDIFLPGAPARSLYRERLVIALHERLGLFKMDEWIWQSNKPPGPVQWASLTRQQLNTAYEPVYWFTNNPQRVQADNRRVLEPHTERHLALLASGGEKRSGNYCDGAYRINPGDYGTPTAGRIPRNVLQISNFCTDQRTYKKTARSLGLPVHGAPFPLALVEFIIKFLTDLGDLVVDPFGGSLTTAVGCENNNRRWITCDTAWEFLRGGMERFRSCASLVVNDDFEKIIST